MVHSTSAFEELFIKRNAIILVLHKYVPIMQITLFLEF